MQDRSLTAYQQYDAVTRADGTLAGLSTFVGYSANESKVVSLAMMNIEDAQFGKELTLTWGEPNGGSASRMSNATSRWRSE